MELIVELIGDKPVHFWVGMIIAFSFGKRGLWLALMAGFCKEVYDWFDYGLFDIYDFIATIAGALLKDAVCLHNGYKKSLTSFKINILPWNRKLQQ